MLANNLANSSSSGFKADREFYSTYFSADLVTGVDPTVGASPVVEKNWTDFSQGALLPTGNSTDLALSGSGFFAVGGPSGTLYTRNGGFRISPKGTLVTAEGYPVRLVGNQTLQTQSANPIEVAPDGGVVQDGIPLGQFELVNFNDPSQLTKLPNGYFQSPGPQITATTATGVQVAQGKLESSNTGPAEASARMISLLRHFEMLQHAIKIGADMNRQAVEEVAKVGS